MKTSKLASGMLLGALLLQIPAPAFAGSNLDAYDSDQQPEVDSTGMFITGAAKGAAGAGLLYYGLAKDPHVRAAIKRLNAANDAVDEAKSALESAQRIVDPSVKAAQLEQAQISLKAAQATADAVSKTIDFGELAKTAMQVGGAIAGAKDGIKRGESGMSVAFDANMGKMQGEMAGDILVGETKTEKAQSAVESAADQLNNANHLRTGTPQEIAKAIADAQKGLDGAKITATDQEAALAAVKDLYAAKGLAKGMKVLAVFGGVVLLTDTAMQGVYFANGNQSYTPVGDWIINRGKSSKFPRSAFVGSEAEGVMSNEGAATQRAVNGSDVEEGIRREMRSEAVPEADATAQKEGVLGQ